MGYQGEAELRTMIGKNLAVYRKVHGDTQVSLGQKLGYSDKAVSKWERGEGLPDIYVLTRIGELYGITVGELIGETKPKLHTSPYLRLYLFLLSAAVAFFAATVLIVAFEIFHVPFNSWFFLLYAAAVSALLAVIFTTLWWNLWYQLAAWTAFIWLSGLSVVLTIRCAAAQKCLLVCLALQIIVLCTFFYRASKSWPRAGKEEGT